MFGLPRLFLEPEKTSEATLTPTKELINKPTSTKYITTTPELKEIPTEVFTPTLTPWPTNTLISGISCDDAQWVADVSIPDGTEVTSGQDFVKTWRIKNTGSCIWETGYSVIFAYGEKMNGIPESLPAIIFPGEDVEISIHFKAPVSLGEHRSVWRMANDSGQSFGEFFYVSVIVR